MGIAVLHQYSNPLNAYADVQVYKRAMALYAMDRPVWIGEANVVPYDDPASDIGTTLHATLDQQASYVIQSFALGRVAGVERMSIYKLVDELPEGPGELFGLVRNNGSTRPAFDAFKAAVTWLGGATSAVYTWDGANEIPSPDQVTQLLQSNDHSTQWHWPAPVNRVALERGPQRVSVVWNATPKLERTCACSGQIGDGRRQVRTRHGRDRRQGRLLHAQPAAD